MQSTESELRMSHGAIRACLRKCAAQPELFATMGMVNPAGQNAGTRCAFELPHVGTIVVQEPTPPPSTGWRVSPASLALADWACQPHMVARHWAKGASVLEVGAGLGVPGVALARLGASVTLTEHAPVLVAALEALARAETARAAATETAAAAGEGGEKDESHGGEEELKLAFGSLCAAQLDAGAAGLEQWRAAWPAAERADWVVAVEFLYEEKHARMLAGVALALCKMNFVTICAVRTGSYHKVRFCCEFLLLMLR